MNLLKRVVVAVLFIPLILWVFWKSGLPLVIFLSLVTFLQTWELTDLYKKKMIVLPKVVVLLSVFIFLFAAYFAVYKLLFIYFLLLFGLLTHELLKKRVEGAVSRISASVFSITYTGLLLSSVVRISHFHNGNKMIIALLVLIWITDTFAYFIGMTLGKHRNIFIVSPNKSLEGFIAGIAFAFGFAFLFYKMGFLALKPALFAAFSAGIIGQFGDLFESLLKRDFGVKDSSSLLPGHGGLLDRFDSLMFAAPMFYFLLSFLGNVK